MSETIFELEHWRCRTFDDCPLPGYLIVEMKAPVSRFSALSAPAAAELGSAISLAASAIERVVRPERVYISRWGEVLEDLHVHLFPRTRWVLECYRRAFPGGSSPSGPVDVPPSGPVDVPPSGPPLFEWARTRYGSEELPADPLLDARAVITALREFAADR